MKQILHDIGLTLLILASPFIILALLLVAGFVILLPLSYMIDKFSWWLLLIIPLCIILYALISVIGLFCINSILPFFPKH